MSKLHGRRVVVAGGTSGIGLATARLAAAQGAEVIVASRNRKNVDEAVASLGGAVRGSVLDVTDEAGMERFFRELGGLDHLVITAGDTLPSSIQSTEDARAFFNVRFWGTYLAAKAAQPYVRTGGSITMTNGILAIRPWKGWAVVSAVAGAVESLTRGLALDMAPVRVNTVCAGVVKTPLWAGMSEADREALYANEGKRLLVGRVGEPEDIAESYVYLMQSEFTTGQVVVIDGGAVIV